MKKIYIVAGIIIMAGLTFSKLNAQSIQEPEKFIEEFKQYLKENSRTKPDVTLPGLGFSLKTGGAFYQLDSIVNYAAKDDGTLQYDTRETFFYNEDSICELRLDYAWDENTQSWISTKKWTETLNESKDTTIFSEFNWDSQNEVWQPYTKSYIAYDASSEPEYMSYYLYNSSAGQWVYFGYTLKERFDAEDGTLEVSSMYMLDYATMTIGKFMRTEKYYGLNGLHLFTTNYDGNPATEKWQETSETRWTYDLLTRLRQKETNLVWDTLTNDWRHESMIEFFYDDRENGIAELEYLWNTETETWWVHSKSENSYDEQDNYLGTTYLDRDTINDEWINMTRLEIITEDNFENYDIVYSSWDTLSGQWLYTDKTSTEMKNPVAQDYLIMPERWYQANQLWAISNQSFYNWNANGEDWYLTEKSEVFFSEFNAPTTGTEELARKKISVFPNPVRHEIKLKGPVDYSTTEMFLFDANGNQVAQAKGTDRMNVAHLPAGIYFCRIVENGAAVFTQKMIKTPW